MTRGGLARLAPAAWLRRPRPTARLRLTLLYGALFLLSGAALLAATYLLVAQATTTVTLADGVQVVFFENPLQAADPRPTARGHITLVQDGNRRRPVSARQLAQIREQAAQLHAFDMRELLIRSLMALGIASLISIVLGWVVAGRVLRPLRTINETARRIGASNLHERLALDGPDDEFRELAATLDNLLERLEASFESQRRFVANASHELRTPLTLERAILERALRQRSPGEDFWRTTCVRLLSSSRHQERLLDALLALARSEAGVRVHESFDLGTIVDRVLLSPELDFGDLDLHLQSEIAPATVAGDPRLIERLVRNLVDNAIRYNRPTGRIDIAIERRAPHIALCVSNTGPALAAAEVAGLFQPFQRLERGRSRKGEGMGLGLSIVKAIADAHDASITATPRAGGGLCVELCFPPAVLPSSRALAPVETNTRRKEAAPVS